MGLGRRIGHHLLKNVSVNKPEPTVNITNRSSLFDTDILINFLGPCVYLWVRDEIYLYIGQSTSLICRLGSHNIIGIKEPVLKNDKILVYHCDTNIEMGQLESKLLRLYKPKYNLRHY